MDLAIFPITFSVFGSLLNKADIQTVEQSHNQSKAHTVQWTVSLSCHRLEMTNESQGVIFS